MSEKIDLKVGDKVRLIGEQWSMDPDYPVNTGYVVTVDYIGLTGAPFDDRAENLTTVDGYQFCGYEIEKVSDAPVPEPREVTLNTLVADTERLIAGLTDLGFSREYARDTVINHIEESVEND